MPDRLEERLVAVAADVEFPRTPELAGPVLARIGAGPVVGPSRVPGGRSRAPLARRSLALAIAALVLLAAAAGAVPAVRDAVGDLLGLGGATVKRVPELPESPGGLDLGRLVSIETAAARAAFPLRIPDKRVLGLPDAVYLRGRPPLTQVSLVYSPRPGLPRLAVGPVGLLLTQFRADYDPDLIQKFVGPDTEVRPVRVGSAEGYWIEGPHSFAYRDARGLVRFEERRVADNALLWRRGAVLLRLEADLPLRRALGVARGTR